MKKKIFSAVLIGLALVACGPSETTDTGIVISDARIQAPLKGKTTTAGYLEVTNLSKVDDALIGVESPIAETVEVHQSSQEDGLIKMRRQVSVDLKAGESIEFKPGSYHLMLFGVDLSDQPQDAALTFKFKHAPTVTIIADITGAGAHSSH